MPKLLMFKEIALIDLPFDVIVVSEIFELDNSFFLMNAYVKQEPYLFIITK